MNITSFQLRFEVFEGLRQMFSEQPLIIPTNILTYGRFSGQPDLPAAGQQQPDGAAFHATLSQSLENCDSIFVLVPFENHQTTCFYNPFLRSVRMNMAEFGTHPQRYVQTWDDPRFIAMCIDALNLETSQITAMNEDTARSLNYERWKYELTNAAAWNQIKNGPMTGDYSNFFIGISLSQMGFQSGTVSSPNTNVPFIFDAVLDRPNVIHFPRNPEKIETSIVIMFLMDAALMIQVVPDSDIPVVKLTTKSIV
jgi:hypothetical protein